MLRAEDFQDSLACHGARVFQMKHPAFSLSFFSAYIMLFDLLILDNWWVGLLALTLTLDIGGKVCNDISPIIKFIIKNLYPCFMSLFF